MRPRSLPTFPLLIALALLFGANAARAGWAPDGVDLCPACGPLIYRDPAIAPDGVGGAYASWWDGYLTLRLQHVLVNGDLDPAWPGRGVPLTGIFGVNERARLAPDGSGGVFAAFLVTGCINSCGGVFYGGTTYLTRLHSTRAVAEGWPADGIRIENFTSDYPLIEHDGLGGALVATEELPALQVRVTRIDGAGTILWPASFADGLVAPKAPVREEAPSLAADGTGGAFLSWTDFRSSIPQIYLQHVSPAGTLVDSSGVAVTASAFSQGGSAVLSDGQGGAFVAWEDSSAAGFDVRAQRYNSSLNPLWASNVTVTPGVPGDQRRIVLAPDGTGGLYLLWLDQRTASTRLFATRLDGAGNLVPPWPSGGVPVLPAGLYSRPRIAPAPDGFFAVYGIGGIYFRGDATPAAGWPASGVSWGGSPETGSYLVADGVGGAILVWDEYRPGPNPGQEFEHSFAARMDGGGIVATLASLVAADASSHGVRIEWQLSEPATLDVERSEAATGPGASWSPLTRATSDASGRLVVDDGDVRAGARYGYRLVQHDGNNASILTTTWVTVPLEDALALAGARPNPSAGDLNLAFSLRDGSPATLELLDVAGRRVASCRLDRLGTGAHVMRIDEASRLPAGIYTARLTQAGRTVTAHVSLVR